MKEGYKVITNVSMSQFSVARHFGGCNINGQKYIYIPPEDALIRQDLVKAHKKAMKENKTFEEFIKSLC